MSIEQSIARVRRWVEVARWSNYKLAKEAGLSPNSLKHFSEDGWSPSVRTLRKIEAVIPDDFELQERRAARAEQ